MSKYFICKIKMLNYSIKMTIYIIDVSNFNSFKIMTDIETKTYSRPSITIYWDNSFYN